MSEEKRAYLVIAKFDKGHDIKIRVPEYAKHFVAAVSDFGNPVPIGASYDASMAAFLILSELSAGQVHGHVTSSLEYADRVAILEVEGGVAPNTSRVGDWLAKNARSSR